MFSGMSYEYTLKFSIMAVLVNKKALENRQLESNFPLTHGIIQMYIDVFESELAYTVCI